MFFWGMFFVWNTWGISDIVGGLSIFSNNAESICQSFWNTWSVQKNAPFVSGPYFWIMLHQFVDIFWNTWRGMWSIFLDNDEAI